MILSRWSDDDFSCDVYCYIGLMGGCAIHVATTRPMFLEPLPEAVPFDPSNFDQWLSRHEVVMRIFRQSPSKRIGLPHDGKTFIDSTEQDAVDRLEELRNLGYHVPQRVIDALRSRVGQVVLSL